MMAAALKHPWAAAFVIWLLSINPAMAEQADDDAREEEMFGQEESTEQAPTFAEQLRETDDTLTIGGKMYMRLHYTIYDHGSLDDYRLQSPNLFQLYLDGRPHERLRAFVRGRMLFDFTVEPGDQDLFGQEQDHLDLFLDQLWLKFDMAETVYVTVGRQPIRWGSGRFWNPTDFLNRQRKDPLAIFDERLGVSAVKLHLPLESQGWNFYAVANLEGASSLNDVGAAVRAEMLFAQTELALSASYRKDDPYQIGLDISTALGLFDLRAEAALIHQQKNLFWRGSFDPLIGDVPVAYSRKDDWIPQIAAGAELSLLVSEQDSLIMGLEYFYNDAGVTDTKLYPWLAINGSMIPFYLGRQYISAYLMLPQPGDWNDTTFLLSGIANLSDGTGTLRFDYRVLLLTHLELAAFVTVFTGDQGEFHFGVDLPPMPGLETGLHIPTQRVFLGLWLALKV